MDPIIPAASDKALLRKCHFSSYKKDELMVKRPLDRRKRKPHSPKIGRECTRTEGWPAGVPSVQKLRWERISEVMQSFAGHHRDFGLDPRYNGNH